MVVQGWFSRYAWRWGRRAGVDWWATGAVGAGDKWVEAEGESRWANLPSLSWAHVHHWRCIIIHPSPGAHGRRDSSRQKDHVPRTARDSGDLGSGTVSRRSRQVDFAGGQVREMAGAEPAIGGARCAAARRAVPSIARTTGEIWCSTRARAARAGTHVSGARKVVHGVGR